MFCRRFVTLFPLLASCALSQPDGVELEPLTVKSETSALAVIDVYKDELSGSASRLLAELDGETGLPLRWMPYAEVEAHINEPLGPYLAEGATELRRQIEGLRRERQKLEEEKKLLDERLEEQYLDDGERQTLERERAAFITELGAFDRERDALEKQIAAQGAAKAAHETEALAHNEEFRERPLLRLAGRSHTFPLSRHAELEPGFRHFLELIDAAWEDATPAALYQVVCEVEDGRFRFHTPWDICRQDNLSAWCGFYANGHTQYDGASSRVVTCRKAEPAGRRTTLPTSRPRPDRVNR